MEEIQRRIQAENNTIKQQTIRKLQEQIEKQTADGVISDASHQSLELRLLWERCGDLDITVSTTVCQALLQLLRNGKAEFSYVLKGLLSAVPSARCLVGIVRSLCDILVLQLLVVKNAGKGYSNPYSIRQNPHPFITVLTSRPDSWLLLQHQVQRLLSWPSQVHLEERVKLFADFLDRCKTVDKETSTPLVRENAYILLSPYLRFVLLEPQQSPQFMQCRLALLPACLKIGAKDENIVTRTLAFFIDILPCLQIKTIVGLGDTTHFLMTLASFLTSERRKEQIKGAQQEDTAQRLVMQMISLSLTASREGTADPVIFIDMIEDVIQVYPKTVTEPSFLVTAVDTLLEAPSYCQLRLLQLVQHHVTECQKDPIRGCHVHQLLFFPLLNLITSSDPFGEATDNIQRLTATILGELEIALATKRLQEAGDGITSIWQESLKLSPSQCETAFMVRMCGLLLYNGSPHLVTSYLQRLNTSVSELGLSKQMIGLIVAVFCAQDSSEDHLRTCLQLFETIAIKLPAQSLNLLPILLYKINKVTSPQVKLDILKTLPKLATNKISMAPILRTLQLIGGSPKLKALSIRLITSLWKQQDRCFPYLQQELMERHYSASDGQTDGVNEVMLAKAASMRDICQLRPHQHGEDLVQPMSSILNECVTDTDAPIVSLILEGLSYLCEEEVIDIKTTWVVLSGRLKQDKRPLVIQGLCKLFSLVPVLAEGREEEFASFKKEVVTILWNYVRDSEDKDDEIVMSAAFASLAKFKPEDFHISYLPKKITKELIEAALSEYPEEFEVDESCLPAITGDCYTRLLKSLHTKHVPGLQKLLTSLLYLELKEMPRGIHHSANRRQATSTNQNKALAAIPQFLHSEYEKNKQPGLRQGLAAGLLFGYDPSITVGRDGKPRKQHLIQFGKQYYQMLYTLINEVSIQPTEWYRTVLTSQAWTAFMDRCYSAYMDCRKAELELQVQQGQAQSLEENQLMQETAWLWARDKLTDLIKSCSKGSPTSQGNSLCALVGLAVASSKHFHGLSEESKAFTKETPEHLGQSHWLQMVANTLLAVMEFGYQPPGRIFAMCQQKTQSDRTPASLLARSTAAVSLSQVLPVLIPVNADLVYPVLDLLSQRLAGDGQSEDPGVINWFYGLGLGATLAALFEEKFLEVTGVQGMLAVWKAVDALERSVFCSSDNRMGSVLGLGMCLSAMCKDGKPDTKVRLCRLQEQLCGSLQQVDTENTVYEALCLTLAFVTASAYAANILTQDTVDRTVGTIYTAHVGHPHIAGAAVGLGAVCSGLLLSGHPTVNDLVEKLSSSWISQIQDTSDPVTQIAAIQGAVAIAGPDNCIMQIPASASVQQFVHLADLVKTLTHTFSNSTDLGLQACVPWLLGHLYLSSCNISAESKTTVPSTYHYLPDTSVLRACTDLLIEAGRQGPELLGPHIVHVTLCALNQGPTQALPPVNWPPILSPIMRMSFGIEVERECMLLSIKQSTSSPSTAMFLTTWLQPPLYDSIGLITKDLLFDSLPVLIKTVPPAKLEAYLKESLISLFNTEGQAIDTTKCERALAGLCKALTVHDPPQSVTSILYNTLCTLYNTETLQANRTLLEAACQCLKEIPDDEVDKITNLALKDTARYVGVLFTRCFLVGEGSQPLTWLNQVLELLMVEDKSTQQISAAFLCECLLRTNYCKSEFCHVSPRMQWLLELMGYIKGLLSAPDEERDHTHQAKIIQFLLHVFGCAVVAWSPYTYKSLYASKFYCGTRLDMVDEDSTDDNIESMTSETLWCIVEQILPSCLCYLLEIEPWKQLTTKIIDWLIHVIGSNMLVGLSSLTSNLKSCLYLLRHTKDFQKITTWSRAFSVQT